MRGGGEEKDAGGRGLARVCEHSARERGRSGGGGTHTTYIVKENIIVTTKMEGPLQVQIQKLAQRKPRFKIPPRFSQPSRFFCQQSPNTSSSDSVRRRRRFAGGLRDVPVTGAPSCEVGGGGGGGGGGRGGGAFSLLFDAASTFDAPCFFAAFFIFF